MSTPFKNIIIEIDSPQVNVVTCQVLDTNRK